MKKLLSFIAVIAIATTLFTGCGEKKNTASNSSAKSDSSKVETISWWGNYGGQKAFIENIVKEFNDTIGKEEKILLEFKNFGGDYNDVINAAAISGQGPELHKINNMMAKHASNGWILPLDDVPGGKDIIAKYNKDELKSTSFSLNGKTFGVPMQYMTYRVLYNKDVFKNAGIVDENGEAKEPKTWQDIYEYSKIITDKGNGKVFGFGAPLKWDSYAQNGLATQATSATGVWRGFDFNAGKYNFAAYKPVLEIMTKMYDEGLFFPGAEGLNNDSVRAHFAEGNIGIVTGASWDVGVYNTQFVPKGDWGVCQPIYLEGQTKYKEGIKSEAIVVLGKPAEKKIDKAMKVYEFIAGEDFFVPAYENSSWIPSSDLIAKATKEPDRKGFEDFATMDKGINMLEEPTGVITVKGDNYNSVFVKLILGLEKDIDKSLSDLDNRYNAAFNESDLNIDDYMSKDFKIELE